MTAGIFIGVFGSLAVFGWGPRLRAYADELHRRSARRTKERGLPLTSGAERHLHAAEAREFAELLTQELPHIRPAAPVAERHWDTGEQPVVTIGQRMGFVVQSGGVT